MSVENATTKDVSVNVNPGHDPDYDGLPHLSSREVLVEGEDGIEVVRLKVVDGKLCVPDDIGNLVGDEDDLDAATESQGGSHALANS